MPTTTLAATTTSPATTAAPPTEPSTTVAAAPPPTAAPTTTAAPAPPSTTTPPVPSRDQIAVQVINGGNENGSAARMSEALRLAGFAPIEPADAQADIARTTIYFAPGLAEWAAEVNTVVGAAPEDVLEAIPGDPNWAWYGGNIDVLVVIGLGR